ncbi:hypothetical protein RRF57_005743 [Xylaria bambusicola]|uniref:Uncharacterized protein n=1 Tax=Xylaria bambusicola TaxID=326684 RepID=A0AAN7UID3_9PEZI
METGWPSGGGPCRTGQRTAFGSYRLMEVSTTSIITGVEIGITEGFIITTYAVNSIRIQRYIFMNVEWHRENSN